MRTGGHRTKDAAALEDNESNYDRFLTTCADRDMNGLLVRRKRAA